MSQREDDTPQRELNFLTPALIGGVTLGLISSVMGSLSLISQVLGLVNVACCLWLLGCPILAAYQLNKQRPGTLTYGDGALVGVLTGVFGALISTVLGIPIRILATPQLQAAADQMRNNPQMPQQWKEMLLPLMQPGINMTVILIGLVLSLIFNAIFGAGGGSIGVAILNRKKTD
jgi:hypothetical protein